MQYSRRLANSHGSLEKSQESTARQGKKWEATEEWMPGACDSSTVMIWVKCFEKTRDWGYSFSRNKIKSIPGL